MKFTKGTTGNPNGRPKKMPMNISNFMQNKIEEYLAKNFDDILYHMDSPSAIRKARVYVELLKFSLPRVGNRSPEIQFEDMSDSQLKQIVEVLQNNALKQLAVSSQQ